MPPLPPPRAGDRVSISGRSLDFSFWPLSDGRRQQTTVFSSEPWGILARSVREQCPKASLDAAEAFLHQAEENYRTAATASLIGAKPVLLYYAFLNLAKALILTLNLHPSVDRAVHGLSEQLAPGGKELVDGSVRASTTVPGKISIFDEFFRSITNSPLPASAVYPVPTLLAQVVTGHRLWCSATGEKERFLNVSSIEILHDASSKSCWLAFFIEGEDFHHAKLTPSEFLQRTGLNGSWRQTRTTPERPNCRRFEQTVTKTYSARATDEVRALITELTAHLWSTVTTIPPYRRYYTYANPPVEPVLPQLLSMYAAMFYLGSVTRYRPHIFARTLDGEYGPLIQEFITTVPSQFLFLLSSNFARREIAQPAII